MKQKMTREELVEALRRNVLQYREDGEFVQYIIDLALYLVEYRLYQGRELEKAKEVVTKASSSTEDLLRLSVTRKRDQELQAVLKRHATAKAPNSTCRMCGAPTGGKTVCPHCGNMT
jgi:rubrerythrin